MKASRRTALLFLGCVFLAGLACWIWEKATAYAASDRYFYSDILSPFFIQDERDPRYYRSQRPGAIPSSFPLKKSPDAFRVFVIGDSIAANYMLREGGSGLKAALAAALPSMRIEAINCGMGGYDAFRDALLAQEVVGYSPDLIILMTSGRSEGKGSPPVPAWRLRAENLLGRLVLFRELREGLGHLRRHGGQPAPAGDDQDKDFTANLRKMIRLSRSRGIAMAVCAPPLNYGDFPFSDLQPLSDPAFVAGWVACLQGDCQAAAKAWKQALPRLMSMPATASPPGLRSLFLFYLGRCADKSRLWGAARDFYGRALDANPFGANPRRLFLMKKVAKQEGALWIDLDGAFRRKAFPRLPGLGMFADRGHWLSAFDRLVSLEIVGTTRKATPFHQLHWDDGGLRRMQSRRENAGQAKERGEELAALKYALSLIGRQKSVLSMEALIYLEFLYGRAPADFNDLPGLARLAEAGGEDQENVWGDPPLKVPLARLYWYRGEVRMRRRELAAALSDFSLALRGEPSLHGIHLSQAIAWALMGYKANAQQALLEADLNGFHQEADALRGALKLDPQLER